MIRSSSSEEESGDEGDSAPQHAPPRSSTTTQQDSTDGPPSGALTVPGQTGNLPRLVSNLLIFSNIIFSKI